MSLRLRTIVSIAGLAALAACSPDSTQRTSITEVSTAVGGGIGALHRHARVCTAAQAGVARCHSFVRVDAGGASPLATSGPTGLNPSDLQAAYNLTGLTSTGTIAIVDAYDDPKAESDLAVYRSRFGMTPCTTANGCFRKSNQTGGTRYPRANAGWAEEISLDIDMASAICPTCKILLVEATNSSFANLATAVDYAASVTGVVAISNSYGGSEYAAETTDQSHYNHPGKAITVSSGDAGYGVEFPASSRYVTAVGGTSLTRDASTRGWTEKVWSGAGSGCSAYVPKPSWQTDASCTRRTVADVAAVADPATGVSVYDTYRVSGGGGWLVFGGTSVAAPVIAGVYALAGNTASINYGSYSYTHRTSLYDVVTGSNGSCGGLYLCTGVAGFDGPTGNGTPHGIGAF
jgi:subtilase family serine protease